MSRRGVATSVASHLGVLPLLERVGSRPALAVLVYHRVMAQRGHLYDSAVIEATPEQFDDQLTMLKKRHSVITAEELPHLIANPKALRHFRVAITFDDGYRDNYANAFPILKSHGLTASFFVATHFMNTSRLAWWDQIAYIMRRTTRTSLRLEYPTSAVVDLDRHDPDEAIRTVLRLYTRSSADRARFLGAVEEACGLEAPETSEDRQFLTWAEASEMKRAGMTIGSHTHHHDVLSTLPLEQQRHECRASRDLLKEHDLDHDLLAYPVGGRKTFDETTKRCAREEGYRVAFSNYGGLNRPDTMSPFDVQRLQMSANEPTRQLRLRLALSRVARRAAW